MSFKYKFLLKLVGTLLLASTAISFVKCQSLEAANYGDLQVDKSVILGAEANGQVVLVSTPSAQQVREMIQKVLPTNPGRYAYRRVYSPQVIQIDPTGEQTNLPFTRHSVVFKDAVTAEEITLDLLGFETQTGRQWIAEPGTATPGFLPNPQDPSQLLILPNQAAGPKGLAIVDARTLSVKQSPAEQHRAARDTVRTLRPNVDQPGLPTWYTDLHWSPDGRLIAFSSDRDDLGKFNPDYDVWLHDVATGRDTKVLGIEGVTFKIQGWTADGRILATETVQGDESKTIVAINPTTQEKQKLAQGNFLILSDDGKTLVYATSLQTVHALSLTTGKTQLLYQETETERFTGVSIDFSAEGDRIVLTLGESQTGQQSLLVYDLKQQQAWRRSITPSRDIVGNFGEQVEWAGDHLLVPNFAPQQGITETLLLSPQSWESKSE